MWETSAAGCHQLVHPHHTSFHSFPQKRLRCVGSLASCVVNCRGRCVRVTCGFHCGRSPPGARSPAYREPRAVLCCCSFSCWPTLCGTALWWTRDTGRGMSVCFPVHLSSPISLVQYVMICFLHLDVIVSCSPRAVSRFSSLDGETVAAGLVTCLIIYPLYLLVFTIFRMSRSKVQ